MHHPLSLHEYTIKLNVGGSRDRDPAEGRFQIVRIMFFDSCASQNHDVRPAAGKLQQEGETFQREKQSAETSFNTNGFELEE